MSTENTKPTDPLFQGLEARITKQDAATRADRVRTLMEALEAQITGAVVVPANAVAQSPATVASVERAPIGMDPKDPGAAAVGMLGIFWDDRNGKRINAIGVCANTAGTSGGYIHRKDDGSVWEHFLPITLPAPYHQQFVEAFK